MAMQFLVTGVHGARTTLDLDGRWGLQADIGVSVVTLRPCSLGGEVSGKLDVLLVKKIMYLCFASFVRTTYTMRIIVGSRCLDEGQGTNLRNRHDWLWLWKMRC